jgi:CheY-like chemotaxis protein
LAQAEVEPGQYVLLAVSDTGSGMAPEVVERAFDPFYTTKDVGMGSGLGLSMIYGFVKQSGGHVKIYSEEGEGTTVKIYLPRAARGADSVRDAALAGETPAGRNETVLVVEDDADVRTVVLTMLGSLNYRYVDAGNGKDALASLDDMPNVDLLLTDVVLPGGMGGRELAEEVVRRRPGLRVLYMSGYTENAIIHGGRLDDDIWLLQKPFTKDVLARKLRQVLEAGSYTAADGSSRSAGK